MSSIINRRQAKQLFKSEGARCPKGMLHSLEIVAKIAAKDSKLSSKPTLVSPLIVRWNAAKKFGLPKSVVPHLNYAVVEAIKQMIKDRVKDKGFITLEYIPSSKLAEVIGAKKGPNESLLRAARRIGAIQLSRHFIGEGI